MTLDESIMPSFQKNETLRLLDGVICRICVTNSLIELLNQFGFAIDLLQHLVVNRRNELLAGRDGNGKNVDHE